MGVPPVPARIRLKYGFSPTVEKILQYEAIGYKREEIEPLVGMRTKQMSIAMRLYLTAHGKTPDSGHLEIKNKAIELVKKLDADEMSMHNANEILVNHIRQITGKGKTTYRLAAGAANAEQQLETYNRAIAGLEGYCYALEKMPAIVHSSITAKQRTDIEQRLAACRRIIEQRINIIRKDVNNGVPTADH